MGPPPKHPSQRRRTNAALALTQLPPEGRSGDTPMWPIGRPLAAEKSIWLELWATPQSVAWERLGWTRAVARYCRALVEAEKKDASAALLAEVRQMEDRLGLTPMSMLRLRWEIAADELAEAREVPVDRERPKLRAVE
jgi:hypothetical protein